MSSSKLSNAERFVTCDAALVHAIPNSSSAKVTAALGCWDFKYGPFIHKPVSMIA